MPFRELSDTRKRKLRYGALAGAVLLLAAGLIVLTHHTAQTPVSSDAAHRPATASTSSTASATPPTAPSGDSSSSDEPTVVSTQKRDQAVELIADARRQAAAANFTDAEAALKKADTVVPHMPEIEQARADIEKLKTPDGNFDAQLARARLAIEHADTAAAEAAIGEASRIKPDAPEIAELRTSLQASKEKTAQRETRITDALTRMRDAVAKRDFAAADSALNEAERIDLQDPSVRRARGELARARGAQENSPN